MSFFRNYKIKSTGVNLTGVAGFTQSVTGTVFEKNSGELYIKTASGLLDKLTQTLTSQTSVNTAIAAHASNVKFHVVNNFISIVDPSVTDDSTKGYSAGSVWINKTSKIKFTCVTNAIGAAVWTSSINSAAREAANGVAGLDALNEVIMLQSGSSAQVAAGLGNSYKRADGTWAVPAVAVPGAGAGAGNIVSIAAAGVAVADGITDDSAAWQTVLNAVGLNGGGHVVVGATPPSKSYINAHVTVPSNTTLDIDGDVVYGPFGRLSMSGSEVESAVAKTTLAVPIVAGDTVISVVSAAAFTPSTFARLRGNRDANGKGTSSIKVFITAIDTILNTVTVKNPITAAYPLTWTTSPWALAGNIDTTRLIQLASTLATSDIIAGNDTITVANTTALAVDDLILIEDLELGSTNSPSVSNNALHIECAIITSIVGNVIKLDHKLNHSMRVLYSASVTVLKYINASQILNGRFTYAAKSKSTQQHAVEISGGLNCLIRNCHVYGSFLTGFGNVGHGFRVDIGMNNVVADSSVSFPQVTSAASGYGFSLYSSTGCKLINNYAAGCRHSFLLFKGASGNSIQGNTSFGCKNSDFDLHGANEINNLISDNVVVGTSRLTLDSSGHGAFRIGNPFHIFGAHNNTIRDNSVFNTNGIFIDVQVASSGNIITNNTAINVKTGIKLSLPGSTGNAGLARDPFATAVRNIITDNTIDGCVEGINLNGGVNKTIHNNDLSRNTIKRNTGVGITMIDCADNTLDGTICYPIATPDVLNNRLNWTVRLVRAVNISANNLKIVNGQDGIYLAGGSLNFTSNNSHFENMVGATVLRTGGTDTGVKMHNYFVKGFVPLWSLSNASGAVTSEIGVSLPIHSTVAVAPKLFQTNYTNTTGVPMYAYSYGTFSTPVGSVASYQFSILLEGIVVATNATIVGQAGVSVSAPVSLYAIIPPGSVYRFESTAPLASTFVVNNTSY